MTYLFKKLLRFAAYRTNNTTYQLMFASLYGCVDLFGAISTVKMLYKLKQESKIASTKQESNLP